MSPSRLRVSHLIVSYRMLVFTVKAQHLDPKRIEPMSQLQMYKRASLSWMQTLIFCNILDVVHIGSCQLLPQNQSFFAKNTLRNSISDTFRNFLGILPRNITYLERKTTHIFCCEWPFATRESRGMHRPVCWALTVQQRLVSPPQAQPQPKGALVGSNVGHSGLHLSVWWYCYDLSLRPNFSWSLDPCLVSFFLAQCPLVMPFWWDPFRWSAKQ